MFGDDWDDPDDHMETRLKQLRSSAKSTQNKKNFFFVSVDRNCFYISIF